MTFGAAVIFAAVALSGGGGLPTVPQKLPPISWTCPMHPEIVEDRRGTCPICRMTLEPVRLDTIWSCPVHAVVAQRQPGRCPVCRRELVQVTMAVSWACADETSPRIEPGRCSNGTAAIERFTQRPHGNHHPQHGGAFFMAPDNWHHLEGVYPEAGVFRIYLYDDYSKPLAPDRIRQSSGRVLIGTNAVALVASRDGAYLESRVPPSTFPVSLTATVRFAPDVEYRFDFAFERYSEDVALAPTTPSLLGAVDRAAPTSTLMTELHERAARIASAIDRRAYAEIWVPALEAKDLALAIEERSGATDRAAIETAVKNIVRSAWMLDQYGDLGSAPEIDTANRQFKAAVAALDEAFRDR